MIDDEGEQMGIMTPYDALKKAREKNLDLVEISPTAQDTELERRLGRPSLAPTNEFKNEIVNQ